MRGFDVRRSHKNFLAADGAHRAPCRSGVGFDVLQVLMAIAGRVLTDVISDFRSAGHRLGGDARGAGLGDITAAARRTAGTSGRRGRSGRGGRSEEHTSELKSLMRISYTVFCLKKKIQI